MQTGSASYVIHYMVSKLLKCRIHCQQHMVHCLFPARPIENKGHKPPQEVKLTLHNLSRADLSWNCLVMLVQLMMSIQVVQHELSAEIVICSMSLSIQLLPFFAHTILYKQEDQQLESIMPHLLISMKTHPSNEGSHIYLSRALSIPKKSFPTTSFLLPKVR